MSVVFIPFVNFHVVHLLGSCLKLALYFHVVWLSWGWVFLFRLHCRNERHGFSPCSVGSQQVSSSTLVEKKLCDFVARGVQRKSAMTKEAGVL